MRGVPADLPRARDPARRGVRVAGRPAPLRGTQRARRPVHRLLGVHRGLSRRRDRGDVVDLIAETVRAVTPPDAAARAAAAERLDRMTKPRGSLGRIEDLAITLAGIAAA